MEIVLQQNVAGLKFENELRLLHSFGIAGLVLTNCHPASISVVLAVHSYRIQQNQVDIEHSKNHLDRSEISVVLSNHLVDHLDMGTGFYKMAEDVTKIQSLCKRYWLRRQANGLHYR